jgi:CO/xanthine dehydrogenase FAD-binding subunit
MRSLETAARGIIEAGRVEQAEAQIGQMRLALAAVAGDAGLVVDQRQLTADQPIEQRRFADIRSAQDRDFRLHGDVLAQRDQLGII